MGVAIRKVNVTPRGIPALIHRMANLRGAFQPVTQFAQKTSRKRAATAILGGRHHTIFFYYFQMVGDCRLGQPENSLQFADAHGAVLQQFDDFDPVGICQGLHGICKIIHHHILFLGI